MMPIGPLLEALSAIVIFLPLALIATTSPGSSALSDTYISARSDAAAESVTPAIRPVVEATQYPSLSTQIAPLGRARAADAIPLPITTHCLIDEEATVLLAAVIAPLPGEFKYVEVAVKNPMVVEALLPVVVAMIDMRGSVAVVELAIIK
jgi:hypothetical protein